MRPPLLGAHAVLDQNTIPKENKHDARPSGKVHMEGGNEF